MRFIILLFLVFSVACFGQEDNRGTIVVRSNCELFSGSDTLFSKLDQLPNFPGGESALLIFIQKKCNYPKPEVEDEIMGMPVVQFTIQKTGLISDIKIYLSSGRVSFDNEAIRVVKSMPRWIPGECNGEKVATVFYLPIKFTLQ